MMGSRPFLSVIVPAHQAAQMLPTSLQALCTSDLPREAWELVVVDDASTDATSLVAAEYADTVVRLAGKPHGPAYARNRGFEASRGEVVVFVDADVAVHTDTLRRFAIVLAQNPQIGAVFGSYDANPRGPGVVSQFRNLLHHYVHQRSGGEAETFWAGCGAVRRHVFAGVEMFDEWHYAEPQIEDIELGRRLRRHGCRILLQPEIQCTHLKSWTLRKVVATDFRHRGTPWMWLLLREGASATPHTLNLQARDKWCTAAVGLALLGLVVALVVSSAWPLALLPLAAAVVIGNNWPFYRFLFRTRGAGFAIAAVPLHAIFYLTSGVSVFSGMIMNLVLGEPQPPPEVETLAAVGIKTWPPAASCPTTSIWNATPAETDRR